MGAAFVNLEFVKNKNTTAIALSSDLKEGLLIPTIIKSSLNLIFLNFNLLLLSLTFFKIRDISLRLDFVAELFFLDIVKVL